MGILQGLTPEHRTMNNYRDWFTVAILAITLASCGGGDDGGGGAPVTPLYTIGGTVTGLKGTGLTLQNNGGDSLQIAADGRFSFATKVASGSGYAVTVQTQPTPAPNSLPQNCVVNLGAG